MKTLFTLLQVLLITTCLAQKIDRKAVVKRHNVVLDKIDTLGSLTVGNGKFAFTVDATGLQSFPEFYAKGIPLGTQSEWGWHSFPNTGNYKTSETLQAYDFNNTGRKALYAIQFKEAGRNQQAVDYYRANPHRLQLGNIGLDIIKKDGSLAGPQDLKNIHQELDLWSGRITSEFTVEGVLVKVITAGHAVKDAIGVKITSALLQQKRISIRFKFPYPTNEFTDRAVNYASANRHTTTFKQSGTNTALFSHKLDNDQYFVAAQWSGKAALKEAASHTFILQPAAGDKFEMSADFSPIKPVASILNFNTVQNSSVAGWSKFWLSGAAIDLAGSTDSRAKELERRIVLSQYLLRVQEAGNYPPQETGLTYNSWYGRPHMEMYWWHTAQYALWGRADLMEKSMYWYFKCFDGAQEIARRQGYKGVRWQKMTDHNGGESPSSVGSFLLWQQPHPIYQAELIYRSKPTKAVLLKYQKLIFATADFMASFATYDEAAKRYNLGKGIIPAQECYKAAGTFNSPYELAYWNWALQAAQKWRTRLGLAPNKTWQKVIDQLAPLAQQDGVYKGAESITDSYSADSKYTIDHPAVLMALSTLPANGVVDTAVMHRTFDVVEKSWHWDHTWGWDFPMVAMTATRLNQPEKAIDALFKNVITNTYLVNGHNYQTSRLTLYLPGNGSLLAAVALMCTGDDANKIVNPGFPKNGKWKVKWEGMKRLP
jgi:hypothetical protein